MYFKYINCFLQHYLFMRRIVIIAYFYFLHQKWVFAHSKYWIVLNTEKEKRGFQSWQKIAWNCSEGINYGSLIEMSYNLSTWCAIDAMAKLFEYKGHSYSSKSGFVEFVLCIVRMTVTVVKYLINFECHGWKVIWYDWYFCLISWHVCLRSLSVVWVLAAVTLVK